MPDNNFDLINKTMGATREMMSTVPQVPVSQYDSMLASTVSPGKPDNYGPIKYLTDSWNRWNYNKVESQITSDEGDLMMNVEPEIESTTNQINSIKDIRKLNDSIAKIDSVLSTTSDPNAVLQLNEQRKQMLDQVTELQTRSLSQSQERLKKAYADLNKVKANLGEKATTELDKTIEYKRFNELYKEVSTFDPNNNESSLESLSSRLNDLYLTREQKKQKIAEGQKEMQGYDKNISKYFKSIEGSNEGAIDYTDLNTYLYKAPGLIGSSSAQWKEQLGTTVATALLTGGASLVENAAAKLAFKAAGVGAATLGNLYTRDRESMMEIYTNYKTGVQEKLDSKGIKIEPYLEQAKKQSKYAGLSDEQLVDKILIGEIKLKDPVINDVLDDSKIGLSQLYKDNMMLSISDVGQDLLMVAPWSKVISKSATATNAIGKLGSVKNKLSNLITYGLEKTPNTLNKRLGAKTVQSFVGRTATTAFMEGTEEGVQYIKGQDYIDEKHREQEPSYWIAAINDISAAGKSTFGILGAATSYLGIPIKSELANDKEFIKNWKGGALLGGLMSGAISGVATVYDYNKTAAANDIVMQLTAEQLTAKDNIMKAKLYSNRAVAGKQSRILGALESLKEVLPEGMTEQDIDEEIKRANSVMSIANSSAFTNFAKAADIDNTSDDYGTLLGLYLNSADRYKNVSNASNSAKLNYESLTSNSKLTDTFDKLYGEDSRGALSMYKMKLQSDAIGEMLLQLDNDINNIDGLYQEHNVKIDSKKAKQYSKDLTNRKAILDKLYNAAKESGMVDPTEDTTFDENLVSNETDAKKAYATFTLMQLAADDIAEDYYALSGVKYESGIDKETGERIEKATPYSRLEKEDQDYIYNYIHKSIDEYNKVTGENNQISEEIAVNDIEDIANESISENEVITPAEETFIKAAPQTPEPVVEEIVPEVEQEVISIPETPSAEPIVEEQVSSNKTTINPITQIDGSTTFNVDGKVININNPAAANTIRAFDMTDGTKEYINAVEEFKKAFSDKGYELTITPDYGTGEVIYTVKKSETKPIIPLAEQAPITKEETVDEDIDLWAEAGIPLRTQVGESVNVMNPSKAKRYLFRTLGLTEDQVEILDTVITLAKSGVQLAGATKEDAIVLWKGAEPGTEYHEAYHRVSLLLLTKEQREKIYRAYRKRYNKDLTDENIEEILAEEYRLFTIANHRAGITESNNIFKKIWNYIKILATSDNRKLHKLFLDINYGKYKNVKVNNESLARFRTIYGKEGAPFKLPNGVNFENIPFYNNYVNTLSALRALVFTANNVQTAEDLTSLNFTKVKRVLERMSELDTVTDTQKKTLREILDKYDSHFVPAIKDSMKAMFIKLVEETDNETKAELDAGSISDDVMSHIVESYKVSRKENIAGGVKIFLSTIPSVRFVNDEKVAVIDDTTGLPMFEDGNIVIKTMFNDLHDISSIDDLYNRVAKLAKTSPLYAAINSRLSSPNIKNNQNLLTQIEVAIKSHVHNFIDGRYTTVNDINGNPVIKFIIDDASGNNMIKRYPIMWGVSFVDMNLDYNNSTKSFNLNVDRIKDAINSFNDIVELLIISEHNPSKAIDTKYGNLNTIEGLTNLKSTLLAAMSKVGLHIDMTSLNDMLTDKSYMSTDPLQALRHLVSYSNATLSDGSIRVTLGTIFNNTLPSIIANKGKYIKTIVTNKRAKQTEDELYNLYKGERIVQLLSKYYTKNNQTSEDLSVIGANGNLLYPVSQNNFMSDFTNWINNDAELVRKLKAVTYTSGKNGRGSVLLRQVTDGAKLKLNTFINFREERGSDKGRDYFEISPVEDYLIKMAMVFQDHMILPTMADKKTYHTISGVKLFHNRIRITPSITNPNNKVIKFSEEILAQFVDYMIAEIDTVEQAIDQIESLSSYDKVSNYHTGQKNGTYFRVFTGVNMAIDGKKTYINFNNPENSQKTNLQIAKDIFIGTKENPVSFDVQMDYINQLLNSAMNAELKKAKDLGLIEFDANVTSIKNKLIDPSRVSAVTVEYEKSSDPDINGNAEALATYDIISDFVVNSIISIVEFEKIFSGDPAYYKWSRDRKGNILDPTIDKIKRLGALLSTGDNLRLIWPEGDPLNNRDTYTVSEMSDNMVYSAQASELRELFIRGNFKDQLITGMGLSEDAAEKIVSDPTSRNNKEYSSYYNAAKKKSDDDVEGYTYNEKTKSGDINQADAACYISPKMYADMMRSAGEWSNEIAEAYRILEETDDWRTNPDMYFKAMKASLKAMKYMSFGMNFNEPNNLAIPFFNKMAIFPLVRGLATGDNKVLYDRMNNPESPIDMVLFSTAVKVGGRQKFSFYKDTHNKEINDITDIPIYTQEFKYLRKQLVTDPHHHDDASLGTQVAKGVLSNLVVDRKYVDYNTGEEIAGGQLVEDIFGAMNALSNKGVERINKKFGVTYDEARNVLVLNIDKFSNMLLEDAKSSNMNINVLDGITVNKETGELTLPLSALSDNQWLEERFLSMITDETVDIHTPGGSFIQMSSFGFKSSEGQIISELTYNQGDRLKMVNEDGSMDAIISIAMFADIVPNYSKLTFDEVKQYLLDNNIIGKTSKSNSVGYRIPTQGLASISALRYVDVLPENYGDMIVLPDEFTKLTGSDFDIDKLYVARYAYDSIKRNKDERFYVEATSNDISAALSGYTEWFDEVLGIDADKQPITRRRSYKGKETTSYNEYLKQKGSKVRYDAATDTYTYSWTIRDIVPTTFVGKDYMENSDKANINKLLSSYITILTQRKNQNELKLSIDTATEKVKEILADIEKGKQGSYNHPFKFYAPSYQLDKKIEYTSSKRGIGPFALNNVHHALTQAFGVKFNDNERNKLLTQYGMLDLSCIYDNGSTNKVLDWLSAMINAFVDIAKDPYITRLNVGNWTYNMTNLFLRTGIGERTFYFMPQPILKEMANKISALDGKYGIDRTRTRSALERNIITEITKNYRDKAIKLLQNTPGDLNTILINKYGIDKPLDKLSKQDLLAMLHTSESDRDVKWYVDQIRVYNTFDKLSEFANTLAEFVAVSQVDTKKFGNTMQSHRIFYNKFINFYNNSSNYFTDEIKTLFNKSFIQTKLTNSISLSKSLFSSLVFRNTEKFNTILSAVRLVSGNQSRDNVELAQKLIKPIEGKVKAGFFEQTMTPIKFRSLFFGSNTVAKRLMSLKNDIMNGMYPELLDSNGKISNGLLDFIIAQPVVDKVNTNPEFITVNNNIYDSNLTNNLIIFWDELLESTHPEVRGFAEDLITYAFYTSLDNPGANSLFKYVPNSWRNSSGYAKYMKEITDQFIDGSALFDADDMFFNNWHNDNLVPTIELEKFKGMALVENQMVPDIDALPALKSKGNHSMYNTNYPVAFINTRYNFDELYVKVRINKSNESENYLLYKNIGSVVDKKNRDKPLYVLVNKRGYKQGSNVLYEYGSPYSYIQGNLVEGPIDNIDSIIEYANASKNAANKYSVESFVKQLESFTPKKQDYLNNLLNDALASSDISFEVPSSSMATIQEPINIYAGTNENSDLSNFAIRPFTFTLDNSNGVGNEMVGDDLKYEYKSVEQGFHHQKALLANRPDIASQIMNTTYGATLKSMTSQKNMSMSKDQLREWDSLSKSIMVNLMYESFVQNEAARNRLLLTGSAQFTHKVNGVEQDGGRFSESLTAVRDMLRDEYEINGIENTIEIKPIIADESTFVFDDNNSLLAPSVFSEEINNPTLINGIVERYVNNNLEVAKLLIETGTKDIVFTTNDSDNTVLGKYGEDGSNLLGIAYTNARETLKKDSSTKQVLSKEPNIIVIKGVSLDLSQIGISFKLGEQQIEALNEIADWLDNKKQKSYTLVGYAGTGKTTIMKVLLHYMNIKRKNYSLAAPTHKAAGVLNKNTKGVAIVAPTTLAKLLDIKASPNPVSGILEFKPSGKSKINGATVIVDEFSLINDEIVDILTNIADRVGSKVLYLGDDAQLFPVGQNTVSKALKSEKVYKLTDIKRQTGGNPLVRWLQYIRDYPTTPGYAMKHSTNITENNDGRIYIQGSKSESWLNAAAKLFKLPEYSTNPDLIKILTYTNKAANLYNYLIRRALGYEDIANINEGETLTAYNTLLNADGEELGVYNSSDYTVKSSSKKVTTIKEQYPALYNYTRMDAEITPITVELTDVAYPEESNIELTLIGNDDKFEVSKILTEAFLKTKREVNDTYAAVKSGELSYDRAKGISVGIWKSFYKATSDVYTMFDVTDQSGKISYKDKAMDYGYASTTHKSQGSTYKYVFVDEADISSAEYNSVQVASQLRYVAMSRPSKSAIVLTNYNIDKVAGMDTDHMTLEYFENNIDRMNNESDDTAIKTCK